MATYPTGVKYRGINRAGAEYGDVWNNSVDGWDGSAGDAIIPDAGQLGTELMFYATKGFNILRFPISWERVQHTLNGALEVDYTNQVIAFVNQATAANWHVIVDLHNYARYAVGALTGAGYDQHALGDEYLTFAHLADVWTRLAMVFKTNSRVIFGLMNEPNNLLDVKGQQVKAHDWFDGVQTVINTIRATGATQLILVPNRYGWEVIGWDTEDADGVSDSGAALNITDSADNYAFDMHAYCANQEDSSEYSGLVARVTDWATENSKKLFLSEMGVKMVPADGDDLDPEHAHNLLKQLFAYLNGNAGVWVGWTAWNLTPFNLTPEGDYTSDGSHMPWYTDPTYADPLVPDIVSAPDSPGTGAPHPSRKPQPDSGANSTLHKRFDPLPMGFRSYWSVFSRPCGVACGRDGQVAVCQNWDYEHNTGGNNVKVWPSMADFLAQRSPVTIGGWVDAGANTWGPEAVAFDDLGNLFVSDTLGNRLLVFLAPLTDGMAASCVLGQEDFDDTHRYPNHGADNDHPGVPTADRLSFPRGLAVDSRGNLFVADDYNHRVLRFTRSGDPDAPFTSGQAADLVIGQLGFESSESGAQLGQLDQPKAVAIDNADNLYIADWNNGRVLCLSSPYEYSHGPKVHATLKKTATKLVVQQDGSRPIDVAIRPWGGQLLVTFQTPRLVTAYGNPQDSYTLAKWLNMYDGDGTTAGRLGDQHLGVAGDANNVIIADNLNDRVLIVRRD